MLADAVQPDVGASRILPKRVNLPALRCRKQPAKMPQSNGAWSPPNSCFRKVWKPCDGFSRSSRWSGWFRASSVADTLPVAATVSTRTTPVAKVAPPKSSQDRRRRSPPGARRPMPQTDIDSLRTAPLPQLVLRMRRGRFVGVASPFTGSGVSRVDPWRRLALIAANSRNFS